MSAPSGTFKLEPLEPRLLLSGELVSGVLCAQFEGFADSVFDRVEVVEEVPSAAEQTQDSRGDDLDFGAGLFDVPMEGVGEILAEAVEEEGLGSEGFDRVEAGMWAPADEGAERTEGVAGEARAVSEGVVLGLEPGWVRALGVEGVVARPAEQTVVGQRVATLTAARAPPESGDCFFSGYSRSGEVPSRFEAAGKGLGCACSLLGHGKVDGSLSYAQGAVAPALPGLYLVDEDLSGWEGQVVYLAFSGAENVFYRGPAPIGPFAVSAFQASGVLAGREAEVISGVTAELNALFAGTGILFTVEHPPQHHPYSTVYLGGNGSWASEHGAFYGLAEQVDIGNRDRSDQAFVFTERLASWADGMTGYVSVLTGLIAHEVGHLLGYAHGEGYAEGEGLLAGVAAEYVVNSLEDVVAADGKLTLREAIEAANANRAVGDAPAGSASEVDIIRFDPAALSAEAGVALGEALTIVLSGTELRIAGDLEIIGLGSEVLTIDAGGQSRVMYMESGEVALSGLTVTGGSTQGGGGGIYNDRGTVELTNVTVSGNTATGTSWYSGGGGLYNLNGTLTVTNTVVSGNAATGTSWYSGGGGIYNRNGTLTLTNTVVSGNAATGTSGNSGGGGIYNGWGMLTLTNTVVSGNVAFSDGDGIYNGWGTVTLHNSIVSLNEAPTGTDVRGSFTARHSLVGVDPGFVRNPSPGPDGIWGTSDDDPGDLRLTDLSPAIDLGDNALAPAEAVDLDGNPRMVNDRVDIGAYEYQGIPSPLREVASVVTTLVDVMDATDGEVSLREALVYGSLLGEAVTFSESLSGGTIGLAGRELYVYQSVVVDATSVGGMVIDVGGQSRVMFIESGEVALSGLTLTGGSTQGGGGGIYNDRGTVELTNVTVSGNTATGTGSSARGGGIYNQSGTLALTNTVVSGNTASSGGGIYVVQGTVSLANVTVSGNTATGTSGSSGGGIYNQSGTLTLTNTVVSGNTASSGGGIFVSSGGTVILGDSTVSGNTVTGTSWSSARGGGIYNSGTLTLTNTVVSGNTASSGGGIYVSGGTVILMDSAVSGNVAGGISVSGGTVSLANVTVSGNTASSGGGIDNVWGTVTLHNSIVSLNEAPTGADVRGSFTARHSLVGVDPGFVRNPSPGPDGIWGTSDDDPGDLRLTDLSPAIDLGDNALAPAEAVDLDGNPRMVNDRVDIGAYEYQGVPSPLREVASVVTTLADVMDPTDGEVSLREALVYGSLLGEAVTFSESLSGGTIGLAGRELYVYQSVVVDATSVGGMVIDAGGQSRVMFIESGEVALSGLTVTGGSTQGGGGGIYVSGGTVTLTDVTVSGNAATGISSQNQGGGIYVSGGTVTLTNGTVSDNAAYSGGGIYVSWGGTVILMDSAVSSNSGGGIYNDIGTMTLTNTTVSGNSGGGINNDGTMTLTNTVVSSNSGGGIFNFYGYLMLTNTVVSGNTATDTPWSSGGGIYNVWGTVTLTNTTVSGNVASSEGGGIYREPWGTVELNNSIVALNAAPSGADVDGPITARHSLVGGDPGFVRNPSPGPDGIWGTADDDPGDLRLRRSSPAVDAGDNALLPADVFDLDGDGDTTEPLPIDLAGNPRIANGIVDMGAYEHIFTPHVTEAMIVGYHPYQVIRVSFSDPMETGAFDPVEDVLSLVGPGEAHVLGHIWQDDRTLDLHCLLGAYGEYTLTLGPYIRSLDGEWMDANRNGTPGEPGDDNTVLLLTMTPPYVTGHAVDADLPMRVVTIAFDRPMRPESFDPVEDIVGFDGPSGPVAVTGWGWPDEWTLVLEMEVSAVGDYALVVGPQILDRSGAALDNDGDGIPGDAVQDQYLIAFRIDSPAVTGFQFPTLPPMSGVTLHFSREMDTSSFSPADDLLSFTGPAGDVAVTGFAWLDDRTLRLEAVDAGVGTYAFVLGGGIQDAWGNALAGYTGSFKTMNHGTFTEDTTIGGLNAVIVVDGDLRVESGVTLTVAAGTVVKFSGSSAGITVAGGGRLITDGTAAAPVYFTSYRDDAVGGDTNQDGDGTTPAPGDWKGLIIEGTGQATLKHFAIHYAVTAINANFQNAKVTLANGILRDSSQYGIYVATPFVEVMAENLVIVNHGVAGVYARGAEWADSRFVFRNTTIVGNGVSGGINAAGADLTLENSIVAFNGSGLRRDTWWPMQVTIRHSLFYNPAGGEIVGGDATVLERDGNRVADPLFVDREAGNYELAAFSPAIDAGQALGAPVSDLLSRPRFDDLGMPNVGTGYPSYVDIGAYERQEHTQAGDLAVVRVESPLPEFVSAGAEFMIEWTVANVGTADSPGPWTDAVYLSRDRHLNAAAIPLGTWRYEGSLGPGQRYIGRLTASAPEASGVYYVIVHTHAEGPLVEPVTWNNRATGEQVLAVDLPVLQVGQSVAGTVTPGGWAYVRLEAAPGNTVLFNLTGMAASGAMGLYVRYGAPPTLERYDERATASHLDQELRLLSPREGVYYAGVYGTRLPGGTTEYLLSAAGTELAIREVTPGTVGNAGSVTLEIVGDNIAPEAQVRLLAPGGAVLDGEVHYQDPTTLYATFALGGATPGLHSVVVVNPGGEVVTRADALRVVEGGEAKFEARVFMPALTRPGRVIEVRVEYSNLGWIDIGAPLLTLQSNHDDCQWQIPGSDQWVTGSTLRLLGLSSTGPATILRPGQSETLVVPLRVPFRAERVTVDLFSIGATFTEGLHTPIDWIQLGENMRPPALPDEAWDPLMARLQAQVGTTWADYLEMLRDNANHLAEIGQRVYEVGELFAFEFVQATSLGAPAYLDAVQDAFAPASGLPLSFERYFLPEPLRRGRLGSLGHGWIHTYEIALYGRSDGSVALHGPSTGFDRSFQPDGRGGYLAGPGDNATLTALPDGAFLLTESSGLQYRFRSDGGWAWMEDTNGHRRTASYDAQGRLVAVTHSNGDRFSLEYDARGRLFKLTDHAGRTTHYAYDATGEHLLSVTGFDGETTTYTYLTDAGPLLNHHLTSITRPGGLQVQFSYDALGRLTGHQLSDGGEAISYAYSTAGKTRVVDALGNTTTSWLDRFGRTAMVEDALGHRSYLSYDVAGHLAAVTGPTGLTVQFAYDAAGNLVSGRDPMGFETAFGYEGPFDNLTWVRDARGNALRYAYDDYGNLTRITYQDGTHEDFQYDGAGNIVAWTNRRGATISYTYNARGQLTGKNDPDTPGVADFLYTYDAVGKLTSATGPEGTTVFAYDPDNQRLVRIDYPSIGGRAIHLSFTYDAAGRRTQSTDQDGHVLNYLYDAAGRLGRMTDMSGGLVVNYEYDVTGRLIHQRLGNGVYTTYAYDAASQLTSLVNYQPDGTELSRFDYTYDAAGRRVAMDTHYGRWAYQYDDNGQLIRAVLVSTDPDIPDQDLTYVYDAVGNRIRTILNGEVTEYTTNNMNQYVEVGDRTYGFDADGNLIEETGPEGTTTYTYNHDNRLVGISRGADAWLYTYDALGQRIKVDDNVTVTRYVIDPIGFGNVVGQYEDDSDVVVRYGHGLGLVNQVNDNGYPLYYTFDPIGSTIDITTSFGTTANSYAYDPFGLLLKQSEGAANPFRLVGEEGVMSDASGMHYMRARWYMASIGSFLTADPIGFNGGDPNLYRYVGNNPIFVVDPLGLGGFGNRPFDDKEWLWIPGLSMNPIDNYFNKEFSHEHYIGKGYNVGYGKHGEGIFHEEVGDKKYRLRGPQDYDDNLIRMATENLKKTGEWTADKYCIVTHNCQHFADALRQEYQRLLDLGYLQDFGHLGYLQDLGHTDPTFPIDPEDKFGPAGYDPPGTELGSEQRFFRPGEWMYYRIEQWNHEEALVPAQDVIMEDTLDGNVFDLSTLVFTRVGFLEWDYVLAGDQVIDLWIDSRPQMNLLVHVTATFDPDTGVIEWWLRSVDPLTGDYPDDPMVGVLPPFNPATGFEIAWYEFKVKLREDLPTGTVVANQAFGEFDFMGDRYHNPAPPDGPWINTIDVDPPVSRVTALAAMQHYNLFMVTWSGTDLGSGVARYDVYVREDDGPWSVWLKATPETTGWYSGRAGHRYDFYSVATDHVGNVELPPEGLAAQATTWVSGGMALELGEGVELVEGDTFLRDGVVGNLAPGSTATVQYGEELVVLPLALGEAGAFSLSWTYALEGMYTVRVSVTDQYGTTIWANVVVRVVTGISPNLPPTLETLSSQPSPVVYGQGMTLVASGVSDADGSVSGVQFWRDVSGDGMWDEALDDLLGVDEDGSDGWSLGLAFVDWGVGSHAVFARAVDNEGAWSEVVSAVVTVTPAPLTVSVVDAVKVSGQPNPVFGARYEGFVLAEDETVLEGELVFATLADEQSPAGIYPVSAGGLTAANYAITYVDGTLAVLAIPGAPVVVGISEDTGGWADDGITRDDTLLIHGVAGAGHLVEVFLDEASLGTVEADEAGEWTFDYTATVLAEGTYGLTAMATDEMGVTSVRSGVFLVVIDTTAPEVTVAALTTGEGSPALSGTVSEPVESVAVTVAGTAYAAEVDGLAWTLPAGSISPALPEGVYEVTAVATDLAGNVGMVQAAGALTIAPEEPAEPARLEDEWVDVSLGQMHFDRRTSQTSLEVTVTNVSGLGIGGPLWLVIESISEPGVTLAVSDGQTAEGYPYVDLTGGLKDGRLEAGQSVTVRVYFNNPLRARFDFSYSVWGIAEDPDAQE